MNLQSWPSLQGWTPPPSGIVSRRAVYGKVHRAPTDYRWIAWSDGFGLGPSPLEQEIALGTEDSGNSFYCWRCSRTGCFAVKCYPSRAFDAAGRPAGLEKQVLTLCGTPPIPPSALAFALLPEVAQMDDAIWWDSWRDPRWQSLDYHLTIRDDQCPPISFSGLEDRVKQGVTELLASVPETSLVEFYGCLLADSGPALLRIGERHLPPLALAALLLPLDGQTGARLSVAGGLPSRSFEPRRLAQWSGVVCPPDFPAPDTPLPPAVQQQATEMVAALQRSLSSARSPEATSGGVGRVSSPGGSYLLGFLESSERWFAPGELGSPSLAKVGPWPVIREEEQRSILRARVAKFIAEVDCQPGSARQRHLATKADLLRALLLVLCPGPDSLSAVSLPTTGMVPALLFASRIEVRDWRALEQYPFADFNRLAEQSLHCGTPALVRETEAWLNDCSTREGMGAIQEYAREALRRHAASTSPAALGIPDSALLRSRPGG